MSSQVFRVGDTVHMKRPGEEGVLHGQVHELACAGDAARVKVLFQSATPNDFRIVNVNDIELVPRRFSGLLTKYSSRGRFVRNWKDRVFEVWSDSLTYRAQDTTEILGGVILTPQSEIITNNTIASRSDRFKGDPPHEFFCGIYQDGRTLWISCPAEDVLNKFKLEVQEAINASVARGPDDNRYSAKRKAQCVIQ